MLNVCAKDIGDRVGGKNSGLTATVGCKTKAVGDGGRSSTPTSAGGVASLGVGLKMKPASCVGGSSGAVAIAGPNTTSPRGTVGAGVQVTGSVGRGGGVASNSAISVSSAVGGIIGVGISESSAVGGVSGVGITVSSAVGGISGVGIVARKTITSGSLVVVGISSSTSWGRLGSGGSIGAGVGVGVSVVGRIGVGVGSTVAVAVREGNGVSVDVTAGAAVSVDVGSAVAVG